MPELPDITVYVEALSSRVLGQPLEKSTILDPFVLRTVEPPLSILVNQPLVQIQRVGKRIAWGFPGDYWLLFHLMVAGRLHWHPVEKPAPKRFLAAFQFPTGTVSLTEAGSKRRASLHLLQGAQALNQQNPGGIDVFSSSTEMFENQLRRENHTMKRALTDPRLFSGIGNSYSDEILHRARISPLALTSKLTTQEIGRIHQAAKTVLQEWTDRLRKQCAGKFPEKVTAFRPEMAVHGKFGHQCPICQAPIQRIRYADKETNYCPGCQTQGRLLADRSLSRLLKDDRPKHLDEL